MQRGRKMGLLDTLCRGGILIGPERPSGRDPASVCWLSLVEAGEVGS